VGWSRDRGKYVVGVVAMSLLGIVPRRARWRASRVLYSGWSSDRAEATRYSCTHLYGKVAISALRARSTRDLTTETPVIPVDSNSAIVRSSGEKEVVASPVLPSIRT